MHITTRITWSMITGEVLENEQYEYNGPVALCDRGAVNAAKTQGAAAGTVAGKAGESATNEESHLTPFYQREMNAEHLFDPTQTGELLTAAEAPAGAVAGAAEGRAAGEQARTRNASGFTKSLDELSRDRMKADAGASEGIAAQDVMGAKQLNQEGAAGEAGLFGENTKNQLSAMGLQNQDLQTQLEAGKSGWLQNMNDTIKTLSGAAKDAMGAPGGGGYARS